MRKERIDKRIRSSVTTSETQSTASLVFQLIIGEEVSSLGLDSHESAISSA